MSISAEGSLDPYIGGINFKITASVLIGNYKGNCQLGAYLSGNTNNQNSLTTGAFAGLYVYGSGVSINRSYTREYIVGTTTSLHLNLLGSSEVPFPLTATIYKSITGIDNTGLKYENFGGSLSCNNLLNGPGFILHANKTLSGDYKFHLSGKLGSNISVIGEVIDLFGKNHITGGLCFSQNFINQ